MTQLSSSPSSSARDYANAELIFCANSCSARMIRPPVLSTPEVRSRLLSVLIECIRGTHFEKKAAKVGP